MSSDQCRKRTRSQVSPISAKDSDKHQCIDADESFHESPSSFDEQYLDESTIIETEDLAGVGLHSSVIESASEKTEQQSQDRSGGAMELSVKESLKEALRDPEILKMLSSAFTETLREEIVSLRTVIEKKDQMISDLQIQVDSLEQYSRRNSVRISGIPEPKGGSAQEDTDNIVQKLGEAIGVRVTSEMIDRSHRVGKRTGTSDRQIIVKFTSYRYRRLLMTSRKGLKNKTAASLGLTPKGFTPPPRPSSATEAAATPVPKPGDRIYVNDDLTRVRAQLAARARRFKREKKVQDTWVYDGDIYVKRGDVIIKIVSDRHLDSFV
ncbi:hypothetical protein ACOMHN_035219 [Nucella lapillus]